jgi:parallel beta-helix repeat protein
MRSACAILLLLLIAYRIGFAVQGHTSQALHVIHVKQGYGTIQEAIDAAEPGSVINVSAGVYSENLIIDKSITLVGEDLSTTVLDGSNAGIVIEILSNNVSVSDFTLRNAEKGIEMIGVKNCEISHNFIANISGYYGVGVHTVDCENITILENHSKDIDYNHVYFERTNASRIIRNCFVANRRYSQPVFLYYSDQNIVGWNQVLKEGMMNEGGIGLLYSNHNVICNNNVVQTDWAGISLLSSDCNTIEGNTISGITWDSKSGALRIRECRDNGVYHNNFVANAENVYLLSDTNTTWAHGNQGNYWDDYTGKDTNNDGIGDTPYVIDAANNDSCPLMGKFYSCAVPKQNETYQVNVISNSTINDLMYLVNATYPEGILDINVSGNQTTTGFCLLSFPKALIEPPYNVTINKEPLPFLKYFSDNQTTTLYFTYTHKDIQNNLAVAWEFSVRVPQDYPTIQGAINATSLGGVIYVSSGTYNESFRINKNGLQIIGENKLTTIIDLSKSTCIRMVADNTRMSGFTITGSTDAYALSVESNGNTIYYNTFESNSGGINCGFESNSPTVYNNSIVDNEFRKNSQISLLLNSACQNVISENSFSDNNMGIMLYNGSANNTISNNQLHDTRSICITGRDSPGCVICNNYVSGGATGIYVDVGSDNATVAGNELVNVQGIWGVIYLINTENVVVRDNVLTNNSGGIYLDHSSNALISNNTMQDNKYGLGINGEQLSHFMHTIDGSNRIDGKPTCYIVNGANLTINSDPFPEIGFLGIVNSTHIKIEDVQVANNWQDVLLAYTMLSEIKNVTISNGNTGIDFYQSSNNTLAFNNIVNNNYGILLRFNSTNTFCKNNFINNTNQAYSFMNVSVWDNGAEGNYWSDYGGKDPDQDGIGDKAYSISNSNVDMHPLMGPIMYFKAGTWDEVTYHVELISNSTVSEFKFSAEERLIEFNVTGESSTTGFCRIAINNVLLGGPYVVVVGSAQGLPLIVSNGTHSFLYFTYSHSTSNVRITGETAIPEFASIMFLLFVFLLSTSFLMFIKVAKMLKDSLLRSSSFLLTSSLWFLPLLCDDDSCE